MIFFIHFVGGFENKVFREVRIDVTGRTVYIGDNAIRLTPAEIALYALFAEMRLKCSCKEGCSECVPRINKANAGFVLDVERMREFYEIAGGRMRPHEIDVESASEPWEDIYRLRSLVSKINRRIKDALPAEIADNYTLSSGTSKFGLRVPRRFIRLNV